MHSWFMVHAIGTMAPANNTMDPTMTWGILSQLSYAVSNHNVNDGLPFVAQREEDDEDATRLSTSATATADDASSSRKTSAATTGNKSSEGAVFLMACPIRHHDAGHCLPAVYSREAIMHEFLHVLQLHHGRISTSEMSMWLGIEEDAIKSFLVGGWLLSCRSPQQQPTAAGSVCCEIYNPMKSQKEVALVESLRACLRERISWHCSGSDGSSTTISSHDYNPSLEAMAKQALNLSSSSLVPTIATVSAKQLAQELELSCEDVVWLLEGMDNSAGILSKTIIRKTGQSTMEVYNGQIIANRTQCLEKQVLSALSGLTVPTLLESAFAQEDRSREETAATIISVVISLCQKGVLHGMLSTPSSSAAAPQKASLTNAIYTPNVFSHSQRRIADSFYKTNGYLTEKKCVALGLSRSRVERFVKESFPNATRLTNSIIDTNKICRPLESAVQHAILNQTFADMKSQLPDDLVSSEDDVKQIIDKYLVALLQEQSRVLLNAFEDGLTIVNGNVVFFFCGDMIKSCKKLLMPMVEEYSKQRAKEIANEETAKLAMPEAGNKKEKQGRQPSNLAEEQYLVPLLDVATSVGKKYPELLHLQLEHDHEHNKKAGKMVFDTTNDGPLVEFCRYALFSDELQHMCSRSLKAEIDRLHSTSHGVSVSARSEGAAEIQNIGDSFESSFRTLCHLLQIFSKSLDTLGARAQQNSNDTSIDLVVNEMKQELLLGCGSCLAWLITEYYLFKNAGEVGVEGKGNDLFFESHQEKAEESGPVIPNCFQGASIETLNFPFIMLKCRPDQNGKPQSPFDYLHSVFPGSAGSNLAQMWSFCAEDSKSVGIRDSEALNKLESFILHLENTCLTLVGIPFSMVDKKTERKILAARRDNLLGRLESSQNKDEVVMCAIVLIYHQVKNLSITGTKTISSVLKLFEHDKKIPERVTGVLHLLKGTDIGDSSNLITQVKHFGQAKNSKALAATIAS